MSLPLAYIQWYFCMRNLETLNLKLLIPTLPLSIGARLLLDSNDLG